MIICQSLVAIGSTQAKHSSLYSTPDVAELPTVALWKICCLSQAGGIAGGRRTGTPGLARDVCDKVTSACGAAIFYDGQLLGDEARDSRSSGLRAVCVLYRVHAPRLG